jgi:hypothetical protein
MEGVKNEKRSPTSFMENPAGVRDHLLRLGIDVSGDPHRRP